MLRRQTVAATAALTALIAAGLTQPAAGAIPADATGATAAPDRRTNGTVTDITLVTGHEVRVTKAPDGKQAAIVEAPAGGRADTFAFTDKSGDLHVIPRAAMPYLQTGRLDGRLFNVTDLIAQGYDRRSTIPLIVSYPKQFAATAIAGQARTLTADGVTTRAFASADAVAAQVPKAATSAFWTKPLQSGAAKVWLDGKVRADLEQSVPLVGAPEAWAAGYDGRDVKVAVLDSGYDPNHPDLAGTVAESKPFDGTTDATDHHGHGTHVAATVAGTGAASNGTRKGVAPGAKLMVGKVLGNDGFGDESWVLAGMEWAARGGAKVINMSLGGGSSDGTDPLSQAVDSLTAETGALFVIAAGNAGSSASTISTPGAANEALTVGNTDKSDKLAASSSRGPRLGDHAVKPELTAPGQAIIAARAAGTSLGSPVDANYTSLNGTSMATPHVAGAAAILAQRHPDWSAQQLKSALVGTAKAPATGTVFQHGAGRLDVAKALNATVAGQDSTLSFGFLPWPNTEAEPITRTATYHNSGSEPVTLDLATSAHDTAGTALPAGTATVSPAQLVVPAGGSAEATVTVTPALVPTGTTVSGLLVASGNGTTVRTPWSFGKEGERYDLSVSATGTDGKPSTGWGMVWSERMGSYYYGVRLDGTGPVSLRLPKDEYMVLGGATKVDGNDQIVEEAVGGTPQLQLDADRTVDLDARKGSPLAFRTPKPATPEQIQLGWTRWYDGGSSMDGQLMYSSPALPKLSIIPSDAVTNGEFEFNAGGRLIAPGTTPGRTPYLYDLSLPTAGRIPATGTYRVGQRDLARIDTTFVGVGSESRTTKENRTGFSAVAGLRVGGVSPVEVPQRTDYVSANGTRWKSMVRLPQAGDEDVPTMWDNTRTYPSDARLSTRWWGAPYSVGTDSDYSITDSYRRQNRISFLYRDYQDGVADHWGDSYWNEHPTQSVRGRLYRGDTLLVDSPRGSFSADNLPAEETTYKLVHTIARRGPIWTTSSNSESVWTFKSGFESDTGWPPKPIPLLDLNLAIPTDARNTARQLSPFTIGMQARHVRGLTGGTMQPAKLSVSYDDGKRWYRVPLIRHSGDRYTGILIHPPKSLTTGWVSVRAEVANSIGGTLQQTTIRAYALR